MICRVCGGKNYKMLLSFKNMPGVAQNLPTSKTLDRDKGVDLDIYQCQGCGLVQISSNPVPYYKDVIRSIAYSDEMKQFRIKQFKKFIKKNLLSGKKIVEIGCGRGEYLSLMEKCGVLVYGLEHQSDSVDFCSQNGLMAQKGYIENEEYKMSHAPFDAFFMLNFLEHIPNINVFLRGIVSNLKDNGVGLVEVPNFDMIVRDKLFSEFMLDHLFYFTKETLIRTLEINGFEVISCESIWYDYILSATVKKREKIDLSSFLTHQNKITKELNNFVDKYSQGEIAVWGAGHQALAILSISGIAPKIKYVVDSAVFKQEKYTPSTHLKIVSPETFFTDDIDAIIVMAGSYSDEVIQIIKAKIKKDICIVVMRSSGLKIIK